MRKPSPAMIVALAALFVALGGVGVAATGGNFILGQTNTANTATSLAGSAAPELTVATSSGAAAAAGVVGRATSASSATDSAGVKGVNLGNGYGVYGRNANNVGSAYGVYGEGRYGVVGKSLFGGASSGVYGTSASGFAGVEGHSTSGRGVAGFSNTFQGVYGYSSENAGVVGDSLNFDGVWGQSESATHAAVSAHNDVWGGWGLWAAGGDVANKTAAIHGQSAKGNAVEGISQKNTASGVYGENGSTGYGVAGRANNGTGVLADSSNGWALNANGNATQARAMGGFVKAMALIDPFSSSDHIGQCFNSQLPPSQATSGDCGISYSRSSAGVYIIDFGFKVDDRFASVTPLQYLGITASVSRDSVSSTQWRVIIGDNGLTDNKFFVFVY